MELKLLCSHRHRWRWLTRRQPLPLLSPCSGLNSYYRGCNRHHRMQVTLAGHRGAVTALRYNRAGALLASGAQDTDVIVWDVVAEAGLFRLRAHTGQVTDLVPPWLQCLW